MDPLVVHNLRPGPEGAVELFQGMEASQGGLSLKLVLYGTVVCLNFTLGMSFSTPMKCLDI